MKYLKLLFLLFGLVNFAFADFSMRKCMLLPVHDSLGGVLAFKVYEKIELSLKDGDWCYFRNNSEIINILGNYRKELDRHLKNPQILKLIAEKSKAGSLIKVNIINQVKGVEVEVQVIAENGEDIYFKEKTRLDSDDLDVIAQTVINWLDVYEKTIPYDGRVIGVLGEQFTVDFGKDAGALPTDSIEVVRPIKKRKHPLLKEIVDWDTLEIGKGKLFHITRTQSQGKIARIEERRHMKVGDWVRIKREKGIIKNNEKKYEDVRPRNHGKLGMAKVLLDIGSGYSSVKPTSGSLKKVGGLVAGVSFSSELWATRNLWLGLDLEQRFAAYKRKEGTLTFSSNSVSFTSFGFKAGYKYLPLGFFYGPQIDAYFGYANYGYGLDTQDGFVDSSFSGLCLGVKGSIPLKQRMRIFVGLEFLLSGGYSEGVATHGDADSSSHYILKAGANYAYSHKMSLEGAINVSSSKANFSGGTVSQLKNGDTSLRFGVVVNF